MVKPKPFNGEVNEYSLKKKKIGGKKLETLNYFLLS